MEGRQMNRNLVVKKNRVARLAVCALLSLILILGLMPAPFGGTAENAVYAAAPAASGSLYFRNANGVNTKIPGGSGTGYTWSPANATLTLDSGYAGGSIVFDNPSGSVPTQEFIIRLTGDVTISSATYYGIIVSRVAAIIDTNGHTLNVTGGADREGIYVNIAGSSLTIGGGGAVVSAGFEGIFSSGNLTIGDNVTVTATSTGTGTSSYGIYAYGDLLIHDGATVTANGNDNGIHAYGNLTILDATVNAISANGHGISGKNVEINGGTVNTEGYYNGIVCSTGNISIGDGSEVTAVGKNASGIAIYVSGDINISGGTVTAIGGSAPGNYGLYGASNINITGGTVITNSTNKPPITTGGTFGIGYDLIIEAGTGGTLTTGVSGFYAENELITIAATPDSGYIFDKWTSSGGGTFTNENSAGTNFTMPSGAVTITATFKQVNTINFDSTGGTSVPAKIVSHGAAIGEIGTLPTPTRTGYTFDGWYTAASGGTKITAATVVTADVTYYAHWTPVKSGNGNGNGSDSNGGNNGGGNGNDVKGYGDSEQNANVTAIRSPLKTLYLKKGKAFTPPVDFDGKDAKGKVWGYKGYGTAPKLTWKSNKTSVATVNPATGKITAKKVGTAKITATALNGKAKITFTVKVVKKALKLKKFVLTKPPKSLAVGKTKILKVKLTSAKATGIRVTFKSSKPSVLSVDKAGKLFALKKGKAKITVKAGGKQKVITVKVK
jgi:uncharacterized repeat protein (TIGR02543 family)